MHLIISGKLSPWLAVTVFIIHIVACDQLMASLAAKPRSSSRLANKKAREEILTPSQSKPRHFLKATDVGFLEDLK